MAKKSFDKWKKKNRDEIVTEFLHAYGDEFFDFTNDMYKEYLEE